MLKAASLASLLLADVILGLTGCGHEDNPAPNVGQKPSQVASDKGQVPLPPEPWSSKPPTSWPQMVLTNAASFKGHTPLNGASSFLVRTRDNRILAATARHLIGSAGGVEPTVTLDEFDSVLQSWKMFPRTVPKSFVEIEALGPSGKDRQNCDLLTMKLKAPSGKLPAEPLRIRPEPVQVGDKVFLIGCSYTEPDCKQNVYVGRVTARRSPDRFRYDLDPPVEIPGFSGAPIVDEKGHLVGVMTVWFEPRMDGDKFLEAGGEDAATIYAEVEGQ